MLGAITLFLKPVFPRSGGVASLCMTMAKLQTPWHHMPVHLHVPPVCPLSPTFIPSPGLNFSMLCPSWAPNVTKYKGYRLAPFVLPPLSCRTQVTPGGTKHKEKKGWKQLHNTAFQFLQAISHNTNMEQQLSFPQQQQHWWSQTAFLCLDLIKPVSHCQTLIWCTTK